MKKILPLLVVALLTVPAVASAQTVATFLVLFGQFLNTYIIALIVAIGVLFFFWGMTKYFIMGATNEESREQGKQLALWGILAFVFLLSLWGITTALISGFGIEANKVVCPDYYTGCGSGGNPIDTSNITSGGGTTGGGNQSPTDIKNAQDSALDNKTGTAAGTAMDPYQGQIVNDPIKKPEEAGSVRISVTSADPLGKNMLYVLTGSDRIGVFTLRGDGSPALFTVPIGNYGVVFNNTSEWVFKSALCSGGSGASTVGTGISFSLQNRDFLSCVIEVERGH